MKVAVTTVTQTANQLLGVEARNLHYLIIENNEGQKLIINVGKKTHDNVQALIDSETAIQPKATDQTKTKLAK